MSILPYSLSYWKWKIIQFSSDQLLSHVRIFVTPWTAARQASLFITNSQSLVKFMPIELVMPYNHLILCHTLLLSPSIFPSIKVFSNESGLRIRWPKYWSFSFNMNLSTWTSSDGQYLNQIDYILCSQRWRSSIQSAKTRPGADCGSDHELLIAKFRLK